MTKREWIKAAALAACGGLLSGAPLPAADEPRPDYDPHAGVADGEAGRAVEDIRTAFQLADWGRRADPPSPFALCTAVEIIQRTDLLDGAASPDHIKPPDGAWQQDARKVLAADLEKMLDEAVLTARTNKQDVAAVQACARTLARMAHRGLGIETWPYLCHMELATGRTNAFVIQYRKSERAHVLAIAGGDGGLSLKVVNDQAELRGEDAGKQPYVAFAPRKMEGADFIVTVTNRGEKKAAYYLFTN